MPLAGNNPGDRAMAHIRTAQRYAKQGKADDMHKAVAHVSRALDYSGTKHQHFGNDEDEVEAYVEKHKTWKKATPEQKAAFNRAMDDIGHASQVVSGMPTLTAQEPKPGAVYHDMKEPLILWYVGKSFATTGHMTPLRRPPPQPTRPWVFTPDDAERVRKERYPNGVM